MRPIISIMDGGPQFLINKTPMGIQNMEYAFHIRF